MEGYRPTGFLFTIFCMSLSVEAVVLQSHVTSLCPGDIVAVFVCEAEGTAISWRIRDNEGGDDVLEHDDNDDENESDRRNGYRANLLRKSGIDHYSFTSVLTILSTVGKELRIECSSDFPNDTSKEVQFYYGIPAPPPPPVVAVTPANAALHVTWTTPTNPGQTISYAEVTLNDEHMVQVNSHNFSAPAVAGTVSVRTVDACGQKSNVSVMEVDFPSVVTTPDESYLSGAPRTCEVCTWAVLLLLFAVHTQ